MIGKGGLSESDQRSPREMVGDRGRDIWIEGGRSLCMRVKRERERERERVTET